MTDIRFSASDPSPGHVAPEQKWIRNVVETALTHAPVVYLTFKTYYAMPDKIHHDRQCLYVRTPAAVIPHWARDQIIAYAARVIRHVRFVS